MLQVGGDTHVGDHGEDLPLDGGGHGIEGGGVHVGQHDRASGGGEGPAECGTDAARRAGDDGDRTVRETPCSASTRRLYYCHSEITL